MTHRIGRPAVLSAQRDWATRRGLVVDRRGYLCDYAANLRARLSPGALAAFSDGSGSELKDQGHRPAKMRALHSSAALAVNVFDFWTGRDLARVGGALGAQEAATNFEFEAQLPTRARGIPPNLDRRGEPRRPRAAPAGGSGDGE